MRTAHRQSTFSSLQCTLHCICCTQCYVAVPYLLLPRTHRNVQLDTCVTVYNTKGIQYATVLSSEPLWGYGEGKEDILLCTIQHMYAQYVQYTFGSALGFFLLRAPGRSLSPLSGSRAKPTCPAARSYARPRPPSSAATPSGSQTSTCPPTSPTRRTDTSEVHHTPISTLWYVTERRALSTILAYSQDRYIRGTALRFAFQCCVVSRPESVLHYSAARRQVNAA